MQLDLVRQSSDTLLDPSKPKSFIYSNYRAQVLPPEAFLEQGWITVPTDAWGVFCGERVTLPRLDPCCGIVLVHPNRVAVVGHMIPEFHRETLVATLDGAKLLFGNDTLREIAVVGMSARGVIDAQHYRNLVLREIEKRSFTSHAMRVLWNEDHFDASSVHVDVSTGEVVIKSW